MLLAVRDWVLCVEPPHEIETAWNISWNLVAILLKSRCNLVEIL